jgi:L-lactate dehydrogenase complex protein LldF
VTSHPELARQFALDPERVGWHDTAVWSVRTRRDAAVREVVDWETLRETAASIRAHTLSRLPEYLEQLEDHASQVGVTVHWAADAGEHNEIVYGILRDHGVTRVVKSKSMLTEECELNPHLEANGIRVVDTDLGERIVQLRGEPPSHIVMPAIHLRREEVGELFHQHLGAPAGLSEPEPLVELAREHLRGEFLAAQAGITGVNFAIAETGGLVVVTNEGNADLGTALPPLHIACMGIEKVIPRTRDLGVFLRLLARSATGQPITSYTSHYHGPRVDGALHLVMVDNGRSRLLARESLRQSLACIRCGACLNTCPVYRRSGGHSYATPVAGPIGSVLWPARDIKAHASLPSACSLCGSCADVCPVKIALPRMLLTLRGDAVRAGAAELPRHWAVRLAGRLLGRPRLLALMARLARRWLPRMPRSWLGNDPWTRERELPELAARSFREQWRERSAD